MTWRNSVIAAGFTEDESICWLLVNRAAAKFLSLPELHPSDIPDYTVVFHAAQTKLLSRPAYRKYLELAKDQKK